ncbi:MAG: MgtC/SapB family protein, partial [Oscillospiraceae bacterium]|nr:MgtC/SapB family protein [Oscillospiraceae bacterium]
MTTLTSQYMALVLGYFTDLARLGAQVIAGVGFIGAGTIIVTKRQRVKGLTTAAGLWCSAIIGLALGGGFYEGGIMTTLLIMMAELVFSKWEYKLLNSAPEVNLYIEYQGKGTLEQVLKVIHECEIKLLDLEITRKATSEEKTTCAIFALRLNKKFSSGYILEQFTKIQGILVVEEM